MLRWIVRNMEELGFWVLAEKIEVERELRLADVNTSQGFYPGRPRIL
ncbi:MAG: hypothetical protein ABDH29_00045 [Aquificaceae bacterium]